MIHVDRGRKDRNGRPIRPDANWFKKAKAATKKALAEGEQHDFDAKVYGAVIVRTALSELFFYKCAYCERRLPERFDVEHYRPKGRVAENEAHPGYYWMAYDWTNLLPSCPDCNRRMRSIPVWDDRTGGSTGGKANRFPVIDEKRRAIKPSDDIADEQPLLLNPTVGQPETHLAYLVNGEVIGVDEFGAHTVDICHLGRGPLRRLRELRIQQTIEAIGFIRDLKKSDDRIRLRKAIEIVDRMLLGDDKEFAGSARYVMNNPRSFGI